MQKALGDLGLAMQYHPERFELTGTGFFRLWNSYNEYQQTPLLRRARTLKHQAEAYTEMFKSMPSPEEARSMLMPKVRERSYWENMKETMRARGPEETHPAPMIFAGGHLTFSVVLDSPKTIKDPSKAWMEKLGLAHEIALEIAANNLKRRPGGFEEIAPGLFRSVWKDQYDATRMMYSEFFAMLPLQGRPVAMVPNRDCLLITGEQNEQGLLAMTNLVAEALKLPRPMSRLAFRLDSSWVPYMPEPGHPAYEAMKILEIEEMNPLYSRQRGILLAQYHKDGSQTAVSRYGGVRSSSSLPASVTELICGRESLLPKADTIYFHLADADGSPGKRVGFGPWDTTMRLLQDAVEPVDLYPELYRVTRFPTQEELSEINSV